jgi:microcystin-dependent protein
MRSLTTTRRSAGLVASILAACILAGATAANGAETLSDLRRDLDALRRTIGEQVVLAVPVGTILAYGGDLQRTGAKDELRRQGWLACDGASYRRSDFAELYHAIGITFGKGEGAGDSFNVPDLRGRFVRGVDEKGADGKPTGNDPDADKRTAQNGGNAGNSVGSLQADAYAEHIHKLEATFHAEGKKSGAFTSHTVLFSSGTEQSTKKSGTSAETRPKNVAVHWIIKAVPTPLPK